MNDNYYYLAFSHFLPIGPVKLKKLIEFFGNIKKAYEGDKARMSSIIGEGLATKFTYFRSEFDPVNKEKELKNKGIIFMTQHDKNYPEQLKNISDPPICLYVKGDLSHFDFKKDIYIGIVGSRKPTSYGEQVAQKITSELSVIGLITVSGMAMGIDGIVHQSTLNALGKTIAVLGCGVDVVYPTCNAKLYSDILDNKGLIISEFPPGQRVMTGLFIQRNRIISGLSKGILVIEGMKDSGTLITARFAGEQGKEVFAVPSPITSPLSEAPNILLKNGAKLVTCVEDILEEFGIVTETIVAEKIYMDDKEKMIFDILQKESKSADELEKMLQIPVWSILQTLSILEIKKIVEKNREGKYQLVTY